MKKLIALALLSAAAIFACDASHETSKEYVTHEPAGVWTLGVSRDQPTLETHLYFSDHRLTYVLSEGTTHGIRIFEVQKLNNAATDKDYIVLAMFDDLCAAQNFVKERIERDAVLDSILSGSIQGATNGADELFIPGWLEKNDEGIEPLPSNPKDMDDFQNSRPLIMEPPSKKDMPHVTNIGSSKTGITAPVLVN